MNTFDLSSYSREQLQDTLRILKSYKIAQRQIGSRAILLDPKNPGSPLLRVEYATWVSHDLAVQFLQGTLRSFFPEAHLDDTVVFLENRHLTGGIRIFYGDDMVDVSFQRFVNSLHNSIS